VDGNDLFAVYAAAASAVSRALDGGGATLIECRTYRVGFHNTSDNPNDYRDRSELLEALEMDPILRLERYVLAEGLTSEAELTSLKKQVRDEINIAQQTVATLPRPDADFVFQHVYEVPPRRLEQQRAETTGREQP
jgi:TPP-dependent pyruvate/acetoin dehydrogenase alpha subunit